MFHPPQASIGLALLPLTWSSSGGREPFEVAHVSEQTSSSAPLADFSRHFPAGWTRESLPDLPAALGRLFARVSSRWQSSALPAWRRGVRPRGDGRED